MKLSIYLLVATCITVSCTRAETYDPTEPEWESLFDGTNFDDWNVKITGYELGDNHQSTFYVEDGLLKVKYDEYDSFRAKFGHIFYKNEYSWYRLSLKYKFTGAQGPGGPDWAYRNSGIMVHGQSAESMGIDQDFPISIEVQLLGGNGTDERSTANLCTPGTNVIYDGKLDTRHCISSSSETYHGDQWVEAEVLVLGDSLIEHYVEGDMVLRYESPQMGGEAVNNLIDGVYADGKLLSGGTISLQSESHPVEFKEVKLLNLKGCMDPKAKNYKTYYLKSDPASCEY